LIKASIDRLYLAERKQNSVACYEVNIVDARRTESSVVEYLGFKIQRAWSGGKETIDHRVAVVATRRGSERPARREVRLTELVPVTPEADVAWLKYVRLAAIAKNAKAEADAAFADLPRLKTQDVAALVALHGREKEDHP
jgi:hypothetical protein